MVTFDYTRPASLAEAIGMLGALDGKSRPLAGGTDLLVQLRADRLDLQCVVDLKGVPQLNELHYDPATGLTIGAAVPTYRIYEDPDIQAHYPGLLDAVTILGGIAIQGRATVGGNLCNASPSADTTPALIVHQATCVMTGPAGSRQVPVSAFATAPGTTVLTSGEILTFIHIPAPAPHSGASYLRFTPRKEMDIAVVGVGAWVALAADGTIADAHLALGAVGPTALDVPQVRDALVGTDGGDAALQAAAQVARASARPITDMRGSAEQRRHLVGVLTQRALVQALTRAVGGLGMRSPGQMGAA